MIDLHTHTLFSDGELLPAELLQRAKSTGYRAIAFTDHVDSSNYDIVVPSITRFCKEVGQKEITAIAGVELTHVEPTKIDDLAKMCRDLGASIIVVHGETVVEPVEPGTNRAAIEARVDVLAHPGLITEEEARLAAENSVALEISGRGGHSFANGHVASMARKTGAKLVFCTDTHRPSDLMTKKMATTVSKAAGLTDAEVEMMFQNAQDICNKVTDRKV